MKPMHNKWRFSNVIFGPNLRPESAVVAIMLLLLFLLFVLLFVTLTARPAQAQTFEVINTFTDGEDGANPYAGLTMDAAGNLLGTTNHGVTPGVIATGLEQCGTVLRLARTGSGPTPVGGGDGCGGSGCGAVIKITP